LSLQHPTSENALSNYSISSTNNAIMHPNYILFILLTQVITSLCSPVFTAEAHENQPDVERRAGLYGPFATVSIS
jgi:hypothetical protein